MARTRQYIDMLQVVYDDDSASPIIGRDSPDTSYTFSPWKWDQRIWMDPSFENLHAAVPSLWDQSMVGIPDSYLQSGVADTNVDLEVLRILKQRSQSTDAWGVEVRQGNYFRFADRSFLFPRRSIVQHVNNADNEGVSKDPSNPLRSTLRLSHMPRMGQSPINVVMWSRDAYDNPKPYKVFNKKINFTTQYSSSGTQFSPTIGNTGAINWRRINQGRNEFIVDWSEYGKAATPKLVFNKDITKYIGPPTPIASDDQLEYCEYLGVSNGTSAQSFMTRLFPIVDNSEIVLYVDHYNTPWARLVDEGDHHPSFQEYNSSGESLYNDQQGHKFFVPRGSITSPAEDNGIFKLDTDRGELTFPGTVPPVGAKLYLAYRATVEVEYEYEYSDTSTESSSVDLDPVKSSINRGFVYISGEDMRVATLTLSIEKPLIVGKSNVYGPVIMGSDYAYLVATAYNRKGLPVPGATITFFFPDSSEGSGLDLGLLGNASYSATAITNEDGQARMVYTAPRSVEEIGTYITHPAATSTTDRLDIPSGADLDPNRGDMYTYKVYSGDPLLPWDATTSHGGRKVVLYNWSNTAINPKTGQVGAYTPVIPTLDSANNQLVYPAGLIEDTPKSEGDLTLVAYWVSSSKDIDIKAKTYSTIYNNYINSNDVYARIDVPNYLKGTYIASNIGTIPFGFRFYDKYFSGASGLDGLTYLSINPEPGLWSVLWPDEVNGLMLPTGAYRDRYAQGHSFVVSIS